MLQLTLTDNHRALRDYLEEVFEELDSFAAEPTSDDLQRARFVEFPSAPDASAILRTKTVETLLKYLTRSQRDRRASMRMASTTGPPVWDAELIARMLKLLHRNIHAAHSLDGPIRGIQREEPIAGPGKKGKTKQKATTREDPPLDTDPAVSSNDALAHIEDQLAMTYNASLAVQSCLTMLDCDDLEKHVSMSRQSQCYAHH